MLSEGLSAADIAVLSGENNRDMFGGNGSFLLILFILLCGGFNGRNNYGWGECNPCCTPATQNQMTDAFNFSKLDSATTGIANGISSLGYQLSNELAAVNSNLQNCCCTTQTNMLQGFNGVDKSLCSGFNGVNQSINNLSHQVSDCCCETNRNLDSIKYENAKNTCDIITAGNANTQRILDHLTATEMDRLRTDLQSAQFQLSQLAQTSNIVNSLRPPVVPAYNVPNPYANYNACGCTTACGC